MTPAAYADPHTPSARGWSPRALRRRSGMQYAWMGTMASGQPQHGSLRVARRLRQACAGAMRMATHRGVVPLPCVPGSAACSWQAGHRRRGSLSGARSTAVDLSRRTQTLPWLPRLPMRRLTDAVLVCPGGLNARCRGRGRLWCAMQASHASQPGGWGRGPLLPCSQAKGAKGGRAG
jgi:hypothetical protein